MRKTMKKIQISSFFLDWQFIPMIKVYIMSIIFHDYKVCICKRIKKFQKITLKFLILKFNLWEKFSKFSSAFGKSFGFWRKYLPLSQYHVSSNFIVFYNSDYQMKYFQPNFIKLVSRVFFYVQQAYFELFSLLQLHFDNINLVCCCFLNYKMKKKNKLRILYVCMTLT